jgi:hypothetical protein
MTNHVEFCWKLRRVENCTSATQHCSTSCHPSVSRTVLHSLATPYTSVQRLRLTDFLTFKNSWLIFFSGFMCRTLCNLNKKPHVLHMHKILKTVIHTTGNFNFCKALRAESKTLHYRTKIGPGLDFEISVTYRTQTSRLTSFLTWGQGPILSVKGIIYFLIPDDGQFP